MKPAEFTSAFATKLERYVAFKEDLGDQTSTRRWYLKDFDRTTVEGWVTSIISARPGSPRNWMSYIRDFGHWLRINGDENAYVLSDQWRARPVRPQPYLLTREEIARFFQATAKAETGFPWNCQGLAFFTLMRSCGLRTCEVRRLAADDVDIANGYIDVHWSKGNHSRRLPLTGQVLEILASCDQTLERTFGQSRTMFFVSTTGTQVSASSPCTVFHKIWASAGLPQPSAGKRPTPYAFRHHFAYANIERWMAEGTDVNAMLPYLSRYMGHASLDSTYYYIHTSPDFMEGYAAATRDTHGTLPKVGFE